MAISLPATEKYWRSLRYCRRSHNCRWQTGWVCHHMLRQSCNYHWLHRCLLSIWARNNCWSLWIVPTILKVSPIFSTTWTS